MIMSHQMVTGTRLQRRPLGPDTPCMIGAAMTATLTLESTVSTALFKHIQAYRLLKWRQERQFGLAVEQHLRQATYLAWRILAIAASVSF